MFNPIKFWIKDRFLGAENRVIRLALDHFLRRQTGERVAQIDQSRIHAAIREPLQLELSRVLGFSSEFESELYVRRFETDFARLCDRRYGVGTHSGTAALQLVLTAMGIGSGDEVITVPNTYIATALAISNVGAKPVFVDVEPGTFNLDPRRIEPAITSRTKAIIPVHLYGQMANMPEIGRIAAAHGLKVIEDACQAFGARLHGRPAGSLGDAGCFSFSTPKNLSGFGNGGMVVSNDKAIVERIRFFRNPEAKGGDLTLSRRTPCYLDVVQIAFLRAKLPFLPAWITRRQANAAHFRRELGSMDLDLPDEAPGAFHTYYRFAIRTKQRAQLAQGLQKSGIRTLSAYSPCLHLSETYSGLGYAAGAFPEAERAERESVILPVSHFLTEEELERIIKTVSRFGARKSVQPLA